MIYWLTTYFFLSWFLFFIIIICMNYEKSSQIAELEEAPWGRLRGLFFSLYPLTILLMLPAIVHLRHHLLSPNFVKTISTLGNYFTLFFLFYFLPRGMRKNEENTFIFFINYINTLCDLRRIKNVIYEVLKVTIKQRMEVISKII